MAKSRMRFDAEVSDSARSFMRGEPVALAAVKPGGASRATRVSPSCTAKGAAIDAAGAASAAAAARQARRRTGGILSFTYHRGMAKKKDAATILDTLPRGKRIGIAFSGGLDT